MNTSNRRMLDRVEGLVVIGNTVLPFALFVLVLWGMASMWAALGQSLASYKDSLTHVIEAAQQAKADLQQVASDVLKTTEGVRKEGEKAAESINQVTKTFGTALDGFGNVFAYPFQGNLVLEPIRSAMRYVGTSVSKPFRPLSDEFRNVGASIQTIKSELADVAAKVAELKKLEAYFDTVIVEYRKIRQSVDEIIATVGGTLRILAYFVLALVLWLVTGYLLWVRGRFRRGLALIRGQAQSG
jgi:phage-related protein